MKIYTSKKQIVSISCFLENYFGITYTGKEKLTHGLMQKFLIEKRGKQARNLSFSIVNKEDILVGKVVLVRDKVGKIVPYRNPKVSLDILENELKKTCDLEQLKRIRTAFLKEYEMDSNQKSYYKKRRDTNG